MIAQFSRIEETVYAAEQVTPLTMMIKGINNLLYESGYPQLNDRYWDSTARHYRGGLLQSLRYPEIVRAGHRSFDLITLESYHQGPDLKYGTPESILKETINAARRDNGRNRTSYHFDDSGWLRAVIYKSISPEYENFTEASDSLFYTFHADGSTELRWKHNSYSTGSGRGSGRRGCPPPLPLMTIRKSQVYDATFDTWQILTGYSSRSEEIWDTCRGEGTIYQTRRLAYDSIGRLVECIDSDGRYSSPVAAQRISYAEMPYGRFETAVQSNYQYGPLREATIRNWLQKQGDLCAIALRRTSRSYLHYNYKTGGNIFRPDSPRVERDTSIYIVNEAMDRVVFRPAGQRQPLSIYDRGLDSASGAQIRRVQNLPVPPDPEAGPVTVCDPLALGSESVRGILRSTTDSGTIMRVIASDGESAAYSGGTTNLRFSALPPTQLRGSLRSMSLRDNDGLVRYLWTGGDTYQITYRP